MYVMFGVSRCIPRAREPPYCRLFSCPTSRPRVADGAGDLQLRSVAQPTRGGRCSNNLP